MVPIPWSRDPVAQAASDINDRRIVKEATSFDDSTLARFFPLAEEDKVPLKVLEIDSEVREYICSTNQADWERRSPLGLSRPLPPRRQSGSPAKLKVP